MNALPGKMNAFVVVRNRQGFIRAGNFEALSDENKQRLIELVRQDGYVTAESYPDIDTRFTQWP